MRKINPAELETTGTEEEQTFEELNRLIRGGMTYSEIELENETRVILSVRYGTMSEKAWLGSMILIIPGKQGNIVSEPSNFTRVFDRNGSKLEFEEEDLAREMECMLLHGECLTNFCYAYKDSEVISPLIRNWGLGLSYIDLALGELEETITFTNILGGKITLFKVANQTFYNYSSDDGENFHSGSLSTSPFSIEQLMEIEDRIYVYNGNR